MSWQDYQEEAAEFFRSIGMEAATNAVVNGIRTRHNVDVLVRLQHAGFTIQWIVECKHWRHPVNKLHVLALREIVADTGSDRGILLCEVGFQSGASEAASLTNVQITSLAHARQESERQVCALKLCDLFDRVDACRSTYWDMPKDERIAKGLRPDVGESGYSGARTISAVDELIPKALRGRYPFLLEGIPFLHWSEVQRTIESPLRAVEVAEALVSDLERRLLSVTAQK